MSEKAAEDLVAALRGLPDEQLQRLLGTRPEVLTWPPSSFEELAALLSTPYSCGGVLELLDQAAVQVVGLLSLRGRATAGELAEVLSRTAPVDSACALQSLEQAREIGLVWRVGERAWKPATGLRHLAAGLLVPGQRAAAVAQRLALPELRPVLAKLGLGPVRFSHEGVRALADLFESRERLRLLLTSGPTDALAMLEHRAGAGLGRPPEGSATERWLTGRLVLVDDGWGGLTPVLEAATLAVGKRAVAVVRQPPTTTPPADAGPDCAQRALGLVEQVRRLLKTLSAAPATPLKTGGLGVREVRRLVKALSGMAGAALDELTVPWLLDLVAAAGLLSVGLTAGQVTAQGQRWLLLDEPAAYLQLVAVAFDDATQPRTLIATEHLGSALPPPLSGAHVEGIAVASLSDVAREALSVGRELAQWLDWRRYRDLPLRLRDLLWAERLQQLALLGVRTEQGVAGWLRPLLDGDPAAAGAALAAVLPPEQEEAIWQADGTAYVAGRPSPDLRSLLLAVAEPESDRTWRLHADRVRDALDAGRTGTSLLADLRTRSARTLPQTVEQAVLDVARRHGLVHVVPSATLLTVVDEPLVQTLLRDKRLTALGLVQVQPGLLSSTAAPHAVLAALRAAGHAPTGPAPDGKAPVALPVRPRVARPVAYRAAEVVARLRAAPLQRGGSRPQPLDLANLIADLEEPLDLDLGHLPPDQVELLSQAADDGGSVEIDYLAGSGPATSWVVEDPAEEAGMLNAWCTESEEERVFDPRRILAVRPA